MSFANSFSSFPPPGTAQAPRLVDTPPRPVPRAPEATVPAVPPVPGLPSPIGAADQLRDQQDVRDLEIVSGWEALPEEQVWGTFDRVQDAVEELVGPS